MWEVERGEEVGGRERGRKEKWVERREGRVWKVWGSGREVDYSSVRGCGCVRGCVGSRNPVEGVWVRE